MATNTTIKTNLDGFAHADLTRVPDLALFSTFYGVRLSQIGEDGDVVLLGHPGKLRAFAAMRAWLRYDCGDAEVLYEWEGPVVDRLRHQWAIVRTHCDDWPACSIEDGFPCHDEDEDRTGYPEHDWSEWVPWPNWRPSPDPSSHKPERSRYCGRCNAMNVYPEPPAGQPRPPRCRECADIADCAWWLDCNTTPDAPGSFPVTYWSA